MGKPTIDLGSNEQMRHLATKLFEKVPELSVFSVDEMIEFIKIRVNELIK